MQGRIYKSRVFNFALDPNNSIDRKVLNGEKITFKINLIYKFRSLWNRIKSIGVNYVL